MAFVLMSRLWKKTILFNAIHERNEINNNTNNDDSNKNCTSK